jgi:hypothetical protein
LIFFFAVYFFVFHSDILKYFCFVITFLKPRKQKKPNRIFSNPISALINTINKQPATLLSLLHHLLHHHPLIRVHSYNINPAGQITHIYCVLIVFLTFG